MGMYSRVFHGALVHDVTLTSTDVADIARQRRMKTELKCKGFDTILKYVVPDMPIPPPEAVYYGSIRPYEYSLLDSCIVPSDAMTIKTTYGNCRVQYISPFNTFYLDNTGYLHYKNSKDCVFVNKNAQTLYVARCSLLTKLSPGKWAIDKVSTNITDKYISNTLLPIRIRHTVRNTVTCITRVVIKSKVKYTNTMLFPCQVPVPRNQTWSITYDFHNKGQYGGVKNLWKVFWVPFY